MTVKTTLSKLASKVTEEFPEDLERKVRGCCRDGPRVWCLKYFWEGQALNKTQTKALENISDDAPLYKRILVQHRRLVAIIIPAVIFHFFWWSLMIKQHLWHLFAEKYFMSITMIFGSFIAGMTSEGGGAIAFPVMTLAFNVAPSVARDFSLMIQSCGMTAAAFTLFFMRVQLEYRVLVFSSLGGFAGIIFGFHIVDPVLTPPQKKMIFVSIFFAYASVLFLINYYGKRRTFKAIADFSAWKAMTLVVVGFCGGIFTAFSGSGLDICTFSVITLLFRISEKVATPTSVILMAGNTLIGFYWRQFMIADISTEAWEYLAVCVPIVVIGAPLGSLIGSHFHRLVLAMIVCILDAIALVGAWAIVELTPALIGMSVGISVVGFALFALITAAGQMLLRRFEADELATSLDHKSVLGEKKRIPDEEDMVVIPCDKQPEAVIAMVSGNDLLMLGSPFNGRLPKVHVDTRL